MSALALRVIRRSLLATLVGHLAIVGPAESSVESGFGPSSGGGIASGEESYKTDLFTGAASLSIPLVVPAGSNGLQPELAIHYHGQRGITWLGQGWDLPIPRIRRITKHGTPGYNDDPQTGDVFALNDDRLVRDDLGDYHLTRENFDVTNRAEDGNGNVTHWVVHRKNGNQEEYGSTSDSRIVNPSNGRTYQWLLRRIADPFGNFIEYEYYTPGETNDDHDAYLKTISYSFAGDDSGSATIRTVEFAIAQRPDPTVSYVGGFRVRHGHRLETITAKTGGELTSQYEIVYLDEVGETPANGRSLIKKVLRKGADGVSTLPADEYAYSGDGAGVWTVDTGASDSIAALTLYYSGNPGDEVHVDLSKPGDFRMMDVNGDGAPEIVGIAPLPGSTTLYVAGVFIHSGAVTPTLPLYGPFLDPNPHCNETYFPPDFLNGQIDPEATVLIELGARWVDYDGDGRRDVMAGYHDVEGAFTLQERYDNQRNDGRRWLPEPPGPYAETPADLASYKASCRDGVHAPLLGWTAVVDINGDGLVDLLEHRAPDNTPCAQNGKSSWTIRNVYLNTGNGWDPSPDPTWSAALDQALNALGVFVYQILFVDINGDGLVDLGADALPARCGTQCTFDGIPGNGANGYNIAAEARPADGAIDGTSVLVNNGMGWVANGDVALPDDLRPVDLNGDGFVDHLATQPLLNRGDSFVPAPPGFSIPDEYANQEPGTVILDLDGDGQVDLVKARPGDYEVRLSTSEPRPGTLTHIELSQRGAIDLGYTATGSVSCYDIDTPFCHAIPIPIAGSSQNDPLCVHPLIAMPDGGGECGYWLHTLPFNIETVSVESIDDALGGVHARTTLYGLGRFDPTSREFRGFRVVDQTGPAISYPDPKAGGTVEFATVRETKFYQEDLLRGVPAGSVLFAYPPGDPSQFAVLEERLSLFGIAHGSEQAWGIALAAFGDFACDLPTGYLSNPDPACEEGFSSSDYENLAASQGLPALLPYDGFLSKFSNPANRDADHAYLALPIGTLTRVNDNGAVLETAAFRWHDPFGNVQFDWNLGEVTIDTFGAVTDVTPEDDRLTLTSYAAPIGGGPPNLRDNVAFQGRQDTNGAYLEQTKLFYNHLPEGQTLWGNVTKVESVFVDPVHGIDTTATVDLNYAPPNYGLPSQVSDSYAPGETPRFTTYVYDASQTFVTSATKGSLTTTWDFASPAGPPGLGIPGSITTPNDSVTITADAFGRMETRAHANGNTHTWSYDDTPNPPSNPGGYVHFADITGNGDYRERILWDGLGRTVQRDLFLGFYETDPSRTIVETLQYDPLGRIEHRSRPHFADAASFGETIYRYDERGRPRFVVQPNLGVYEAQYQGLATIYLDPENRRVDTLRDGAGQIVEVTEYQKLGSISEDVATTQYVWDAVGRLALVCDPDHVQTCDPISADPRHSTRIEYDTLGRRVRLLDPDAGESTFEYDAAGNLLLSTDARGRSVRLKYDPVYGRLQFEDWEDDGTDEVTYVYGDELVPPPAYGRGLPVQVAHPDAVFDYIYGVRGLVASETVTFADTSESHTVSGTYDGFDRPLTTTYPDGEVIERIYDSLRLDQIYSSERVYLADAQHNADGNPTRMDFGNGDVWQAGYGPITGRLQWRSSNPGGGTAFLSRTYTHNLVGLVDSVTDAVDPSESLANITYDGVARLTGAVRGGSESLTYAYDLLGNLTQKDGVVQVYDHPTKPHALVTRGASPPLTYDAAGNVTSRKGQTLAYDVRGQLDTVTGLSLPLGFAYDWTGERMRKTHGADRSVFLGPDVEIRNQVRLIKTIRANGVVVARVESLLTGGGGAALQPAVRRVGWNPWGLARVMLSALVAAILTAMLFGASEAAPGLRALAAALAVLLAFLPAWSTVAYAAVKGDVNQDGVVDAADATMVIRYLSDSQMPLNESLADVAPLTSGTAGDGTVSAADAAVLLRALGGDDVDGDGVDLRDENLYATSPFLLDTDGDGTPDTDLILDPDQDGLNNADEAALGTDPANPDSDGDGLVDGKDSDPATLDPGGVYWIHTDHLGSTAVVTDENGTVVRTLSYDLWGSLRSDLPAGGGISPDPDEKYTSQRWDAESGLAYYGARYYDPSTGRFLQPDPVVPDVFQPQTLNAYSYVANDPVNFTDPTGLVSEGGGSGGGGTFGFSFSSGGDLASLLGTVLGYEDFVNSTLNYLIGQALQVGVGSGASGAEGPSGAQGSQSGQPGLTPIEQMEARGVEVADASGKIMVGTIPGPDGRPIPIFRDIGTGEGQIGFDDPGPGAKLFRKGLEAPPRAILRGADAVLNNPAMDALATVPPGQPVTGEPRVDRALSVLQVIREGFNRIFKSPPPP